jgi:fucose 4-O-acetylase-like acetyltransferase
MTLIATPAGRDSYIDCFKGAIILWVIHIHTVYWSGYAYIPEHVRQITLLVDVPIFFFISGYLTKPSAFYPALRKTAKNFIRLYFEYIAISCLILVAIVLVKTLSSGWTKPDFSLAIASMLRMTPHGEIWNSVRVYGGSLWYIKDYLSLLVFVPFLLGIRQIYDCKIQVLFTVLLFTALFPKEYPDQTFVFSSYGSVSFYLFFFLWGVIFKEREQILAPKIIVTQLVLSILLGLVVYFFDGQQLNIQKYKFPPSTQYLIYSLILVHFFMLLKRWGRGKVKIGHRWWVLILRWCGMNTFSIYLFQGFVCSLPYFFIEPLVPRIHPAALYLLVLSSNIAITLLLAYAYRSAKDLISSSAVSGRKSSPPPS